MVEQPGDWSGRDESRGDGKMTDAKKSRLRDVKSGKDFQKEISILHIVRGCCLVCTLFGSLAIAPEGAVAGEETASPFEVVLYINSSDAEFDTLLEDRTGSLVLQYSKHNPVRVYFQSVDGPLVENEDLAFSLANSAHVLTDFVEKNELHYLTNTFGAPPPGEEFVRTERLYAPMCQWPYNSVLRIKADGAEPRDLMFFRTLPEAATDTYQIWCENGPGEVTLRTRYENLGSQIFYNRKNESFIAFATPPVVIRLQRWTDKSILSGSLVPGVLFTSAALTEQLYINVASYAFSPQAAVEHIESELDTIRN